MRIFKRLTWREIFTIGLVFGVTGCATSGLSGTTTLSTKYDSNVMADGTEHTIFEQTAKGKAGDVLQAVSQASLDTSDGTGSRRTMSVGANQNNDATRRADSIDAMNTVWAQTVQQINATWTALLSVIAPDAAKLISEHMQIQGTNEAARIEGRTQNVGRVIERLPEPTTMPRPVVTQPTPDPVPPVVTPPAPETPLTDGTLPAGTPIPVPEG